VLLALPIEDNQDLLQAHETRTTGAPLFVKPADESTAEVLHRIQDALDEGSSG
jgi:hypothetical protein